MIPRGLIIYRGPSLITGDPIVAVATNFKDASRNPKTGRLIQTYILVDGPKPHEARTSGADRAVCGDCIHRAGSCYVNLVQGPLAVWRALQKGSYLKYHSVRHKRLFRGRLVRLGTYGDPAAVPLNVWEKILNGAAGWRGYTHQWAACNPGLARYCMASCETAEQLRHARALGWRTYRTTLPGGELEAGEFWCPASDREGKRLTCQECKACSGATDSPKAASPAIPFHGTSLANNWQLRMFQAGLSRLSLPVVR